MSRIVENKSWYKKLNDNYKNPKNLMSKKMEIVISLLDNKNCLLDVGSGSGELISRVVNRYQKIVGVEINKNAFSILKKKFANYKHVNILRGLLGDISIGKEKYDVCTTLDVLEHIKDPGLFVRKIYGVIRNNGQYVVTVPNWYNYITAKVLKGNPYHVTFHTIYGWKKILEEGGFKVELVRSVEWPIIKSEFLAKKTPFFGKCLLFVCRKQQKAII